MKILLPVSLNPISRRKDKSVKISLETRELAHDEMLTLMALEGAEMWMALVPNPDGMIEVPDVPAEVEEKTPSTRLRNVLFVMYKKAVEEGKFVGIFDVYYKERMEKIIEQLKAKLD